MHWSSRVWEMGGTSPEGKQLWWSREATAADWVRRREYEEAFKQRRENDQVRS